MEVFWGADVANYGLWSAYILYLTIYLLKKNFAFFIFTFNNLYMCVMSGTRWPLFVILGSCLSERNEKCASHANNFFGHNCFWIFIRENEHYNFMMMLLQVNQEHYMDG